jgi:acetylornithine deacetylase/succinyl-diaminopimelate desuccinylase-like protein
MVQEIDPWVLEVQKELTAIPAPSFEEGPRGERMAELFREVGLRAVRADEVGNVLAEGPEAPTSPFVISAHLDTVFPPGTDVTPRTVDALIRAPGIADDGRGLAALLALARVLSSVELPLPFPVLFVATVGEEGIGNLRGVRHLFRNGGPGSDARGFISLDGVGLDRIITRGVGSTRLRVTLRGPGGHSWTDWGLPNPIHTLGRIVTDLEELPIPSTPRTTATVARWGGGRSINAIPQEAWVEVDLRSEGSEALERLEEAFSRRCQEAVSRTRVPEGESGDVLKLEITELGRRPAGTTPPESPLVRRAIQATRACGVEPQLASSSTDANVPMALGIPAITLGAGGKAGGIHTLDEWYSNSKGPEGILRALYTLLLSG